MTAREKRVKAAAQLPHHFIVKFPLPLGPNVNLSVIPYLLRVLGAQ
jgi:hypothetical protein